MEPTHNIGIRHLKAHLSECLRRVQAGELLTVTDRGRAIALLTPVQRRASHDWAHAMVARGRARWSGGKPAGLATRVRSRGKPASAMVIEDRR
jgi:prevent-host-death family protein